MATSKTQAGIPVKLLYEAQTHTITIELKNGDSYRGQLLHNEENMNCLLEGVTKIRKDGKQETLAQVYLRGGQIRYFILPEVLKHAGMFVRKGKAATAGAGRGRGRNLAGRAAAAAGRGK